MTGAPGLDVPLCPRCGRPILWEELDPERGTARALDPEGTPTVTRGLALAFLGAWAAIFSSLLGVWQAVPYLFADAG